jgi:tetratricopeptide (TPR) repeat protein
VNRILLSLFIIVAFSFGWQSNGIAQDAKLNKLVKLYFKGKEQKAVDKLWKLARKNDEIAYWNGLIDMTQYRYQHAWDDMISLLLSGESNVVLNDKQALYSDFINATREADRVMINTKSSLILRNHLVDYEPDTNVLDSAKKEFDLAEIDFANGDYNKAINHYYNAIKIQPNYYKATMYLGDGYYVMEVMDSALVYFKRASSMYPDLLEPRKYISDAYSNLTEYEEARKAALGCFYIYPDADMFYKYQFLCGMQDKSFERKWLKREIAANSLNVSPSVTNSPEWSTYASARAEMLPFCDSNDIVIQKNALSNATYLEVYSWEKMLLAHPDVANFAFAREMMNEGYLDCFVFISQFQSDLYPQYRHFVASNQHRIKIYIEKYLTE